MSAVNLRLKGCSKKIAPTFVIIFLLLWIPVAVAQPALSSAGAAIRLMSFLKNRQGEAMMSCMKTVVLLCFVLCAVACAQVLVTHDYDKDVDYFAYKTYGWHSVERSLEMNDLVVNRVQDAVNRELQLRGFTLVQEQPDLFIAIHIVTRQKLSITDWGYATGSHWHRGYGYGYSGGLSSRTYEEGTLMIDLVDRVENRMVWRGTATDIVDPAMSPEERTQEINKAVFLILQKFPPAP